ncbi:MAG: DUF3189 family protein [Mahellales bacterium]
MKILYACYGGAHTSVTSAAIHLGLLPDDRVPSSRDFYSIPFYDKMPNKQLGTPRFMGVDKMGWEIYVMGMGSYKKLVTTAVYSMLKECGLDPAKLFIVNALAPLSPITAVGGFCSRKLNLVGLGRPLTIFGIRQTYHAFVDVVKRTKQKQMNYMKAMYSATR